jgi:hypothetical protein
MDTLSGHRALWHLRALQITPYTPKQARSKRAEKTRDYRRHGYRRQTQESL